MYKDVISGLYYAIGMDLGISFGLFYDYIVNGLPLFLTVLGIRIGCQFLKEFMR